MPLTAEQQREIDKALEKEVNELDGYYETEESPKSDDEPESAPDEDQGDDAPDDEASDSDEPSPGSEPESESEPAEPAEEEEPPLAAQSVIEELRKQINEQNKFIRDLQSKSAPSAPPPAAPPVAPPAPTPAPPPVQPPAPEAEWKDVDYVSELDMDDVTADPEVFNQVLNSVVKSAVAAAKTQATQEAVRQTLLAIPQVIQAQIHQQTFINEAVKNFYSENDDLQPVKETVAQIAQNIAAEHPEYDVTQLFTEAAKVTRTVLKMPEPKSSGKRSGPNPKEFENPAFAARKTFARETPEQVSALQAEIDEL